MGHVHEILERLRITNPAIFKAIETLILSYAVAPIKSASDTTGGGEHPPKPPDHP